MAGIRSALFAALLGAGACQVGTEVPAVPWLHGMTDVAVSEQANDSVTRRLDEWSPAVDVDECAGAAYPGIELTADVAGSTRKETVLASYAQGIVVLDGERRLVASTPGYRCGGTADEIQAVVVGSAFGDRTLVIVGTTGGHREADTWLGMFRVGFDKRLDPVFTGVVEERRGDRVEQGAVHMLPGALIYTPPGRTPTLWFWNPVARAYLLPGHPVDDSHDDGPRDETFPQT
ncbi:MAG TPA: hypothetical protein VFQ53_34685 [Kofleriaceae bacterium]|nr:hypothetical protein [Kofleriaceae bacterium]